MIFEYWKKPQAVIVSDSVAYGRVGCNLHLLGYNGMIKLASHGSAVNPDYLLEGLKPDLIILRFPQFNRVCSYV